ncbi:NADH-quinone oxidoreductase subunit NuoE family protein [Tuwongella immobilis]|uniref:NAD(P)H-dependent oxidoreductase subunit E n=1 Tax=Tuwongella immobilis TaxID=692036 RepID=A0A6C2YHQ5_9BACT|nr:NAD(P)H-dependent oxidoreductase subunit E [Tuwongella immobilis]VIP00894.1 nadh dehydrogenase : NADH dehydrogenase (Ubiquinone) 24 kDa subunit OS=Planctomyces limnophilus (strain ATCC 43296 / DSM 3776 / IFAM 1008 / 290) GN=Plim_3860 PE=4 SV=1: 2Fe-2S_thioredx [Tuwongella immobilis]VTR97206.1 nadh dehydrogenase : NADH dehydrogenase (Ubiquinone) 24 kDa subunit OS=Planctomyces limnophilus (strain ATCC 43296 / DSM 3776 / IFAM 1008 / 290) GN=Plim_3860 PE=4 SV=1: 2Fe-2S_thioredx [Tuwongella immobil
MPVLTEDMKNRIRGYLPLYPTKQAVTLPALHLVHEELRCVPMKAIEEIAEILELSPAQIHDTMTFYGFFKDEDHKQGRCRFWVCRGLACMLRGGYELLNHCSEKLHLAPGETSADGKITLEFAECIGACDGAPAVLLNDEHVMNVTPEKADQLIGGLK